MALARDRGEELSEVWGTLSFYRSASERGVRKNAQNPTDRRFWKLSRGKRERSLLLLRRRRFLRALDLR